MTLGTTSPTAFAQKALTELRPLGRGSSELGTLRKWRRRWRCHKSSHIWSPNDAAPRRSIGPGIGRRSSRSESGALFDYGLRHSFRHGFLGWSTSSGVVNVCNYDVLKPTHEDRSARVVGEHSIKHIQLSRRQYAEDITHLIRSITISVYMIIAATRHTKG